MEFRCGNFQKNFQRLQLQGVTVHGVIKARETRKMILLPPILELTPGNPTPRVLALDDKYTEPGHDKVIDMHRASTGRNDHIIENGIAAFLEPRSQHPPDPCFGNITPETGRGKKDDQ